MDDVSPSNPDRRPLPDGWVQHFEASRQLWYYVQIAVAPPKVSFTHPADLNPRPSNQGARTPNPTNGSQLSIQSPNAYGASAYPSPLSANQPRGMSIAQRLYASSAAPMIGANDITCLSTSLDVSPQSKNMTIPSPPLSAFAGTQDSRVANHFPPHRQGIDEAPTALYGDRLHKRRSPTSPPVVSPSSSHTIHGRRHAFSSPMPQISYSGNSAVSLPRQTPHLITKAKPPDSTKPITKFPLQAPSPSPLSPLNLNPTSPPPTSLLFSNSAQQNPSPISPPSMCVSPLSGASIAGSGNVNIYGSTLSHCNPANTITLLRVAFSSGMDGFTEGDLQDVANGKPSANYQAVINALKQKQNRPQQVWLQSGVGVQHQHAAQNTLDYKALITTVENLQLKAQLAQHQESMDALKRQEAALAAQQAVINQQAQQQALMKMQLLQQQQQQVQAQQQAFIQHQVAYQHQQQPAGHLQTMQQPVRPVSMQQATHCVPQAQQQNQNAVTSMACSNSQQQGQQQPTSQFFSSMMGSLQSGTQQQSDPNANSLASQVGNQVTTHLVNSFMGNGSNQGDPTASGAATDPSAAGGGWDSFAQTLNGAIGGNNQDPSQGLFGGMSQSWMDSIGNMDLGSLSTGFDSSSFGGDFSGDC